MREYECLYRYGDQNLTYLTSSDRLYGPRWRATVRVPASVRKHLRIIDRDILFRFAIQSIRVTRGPLDYRQGSKLYVHDVMLQAVQPTLACDRDASCAQERGASTVRVLYESTSARTCTVVREWA